MILRAFPLLCLFSMPAGHASAAAAHVTLGRAAVTLDGPWKFNTGDDPRWADPAFDDSGWESMDLTAPPGANDGDVGLPEYAPGWSAKGHPGYQGYAWYRIHLDVTTPRGETLAMLGPWAGESAYQMYASGLLLGGVGDFSGVTPAAYSYHYPRYFTLPPGAAGGGPLVLAVRVWAGPWAGGRHIAPAIGEQDASRQH